jgi:MOSC domain-containing protein YiiM
MQIISLNVGKVMSCKDDFSSEGQTFLSAIHKSSISTFENPKAVQVNFLGLDADEQADTSVHGGHDKALYAYPIEHYPFWENLIQSELHHQKTFAYGHFGENITISGLLEHDVWVGDLWFIGDLELRVTKLREPCFKFNVKMDYKMAAKTMIKTAKSGWYLKVIKEGAVKAGDAIKVIHGPQKISIKHQNDALLSTK